MFETNCFQFRVANKLFGSNSSKTNGAAKTECEKMKVNLVKYDDSDTSCHGYAGFFVKLELDHKVDAEEFLSNFNRKNKLIKTPLQIKFQHLQKKRFYNLFYENDENEISLLNCQVPVERIRLFKSSKGLFCNSYLKKKFN